MAALMSDPSFLQLRQLIQANPNMLEQVLTTIAQTNPEMFALIQSNQQRFLELLNEPLPGSASPAGAGRGAPAGLGTPGANPLAGVGAGGPQIIPDPRGRGVQIRLTTQDKEAIDRVCTLSYRTQFNCFLLIF